MCRIREGVLICCLVVSLFGGGIFVLADENSNSFLEEVSIESSLRGCVGIDADVSVDYKSIVNGISIPLKVEATLKMSVVNDPFFLDSSLSVGIKSSVGDKYTNKTVRIRECEDGYLINDGDGYRREDAGRRWQHISDGLTGVDLLSEACLIVDNEDNYSLAEGIAGNNIVSLFDGLYSMDDLLSALSSLIGKTSVNAQYTVDKLNLVPSHVLFTGKNEDLDLSIDVDLSYDVIDTGEKLVKDRCPIVNQEKGTPEGFYIVGADLPKGGYFIYTKDLITRGEYSLYAENNITNESTEVISNSKVLGLKLVDLSNIQSIELSGCSIIPVDEAIINEEVSNIIMSNEDERLLYLIADGVGSYSLHKSDGSTDGNTFYGETYLILNKGDYIELVNSQLLE